MALLMGFCGRSSHIVCKTLFSSSMVFGLGWKPTDGCRDVPSPKPYGVQCTVRCGVLFAVTTQGRLYRFIYTTLERHQRIRWTLIKSFVGNACQPHDNLLSNRRQTTKTLHCPWEKMWASYIGCNNAGWVITDGHRDAQTTRITVQCSQYSLH